ncbi:hypothetical protein NGRA_0305 [Nosema granulosis]|uniref:Uncharacterized protein n=1 Tax=Nosema granulosis TaxID=83296 RepID=A0A9P6H3U7_9MICR|nr:hypothetical protein NGRA_0305 [Nosema granulosis]
MSKKGGLLPYYLKLYTFFRTIYLLVEQNRYVGLFFSRSYVFILCFLSFLRILSLQHITKRSVYLFIGLTFFLEGLIFFYFKEYLGFTKLRLVFEAMLAFFTIITMVYLYPYYLLDIKKE